MHPWLMLTLLLATVAPALLAAMVDADTRRTDGGTVAHGETLTTQAGAEPAASVPPPPTPAGARVSLPPTSEPTPPAPDTSTSADTPHPVSGPAADVAPGQSPSEPAADVTATRRQGDPMQSRPAVHQTSGPPAGGAVAGPGPARLERLLDAIRTVETGGHADPAHAVGDGGRSRGPYQIGRAYWADAWQGVADAPGYQSHVGDEAACRATIVRYWRRYASEDLDLLIGGGPPWAVYAATSRLARLHNGGPRADVKAATIVYAAKVQRALAGG